MLATNQKLKPAFSSKYYKHPLMDGIEALWAKNYKTSFPSHYHPTFNITLVYEGAFPTQLHNKALIAPTGSILITNPQEIHANPFDKNGLVSFFTFYITPSFFEHCNQNKPVCFEKKVINDKAVFTALHQLANTIEHSGTSPSWEDRLKKALQMLAANHASHLKAEGDGARVDLFNEYISDNNNAEKFSLTDAAKHFGLDKYKFIRLFKFQTGLTPNNYFILQRIEKSKTMLADGRDLLSVAIDLGFYDAAHYCKYFKKFTGVSPMAYSAFK